MPSTSNIRPRPPMTPREVMRYIEAHRGISPEQLQQYQQEMQAVYQLQSRGDRLGYANTDTPDTLYWNEDRYAAFAEHKNREKEELSNFSKSGTVDGVFTLVTDEQGNLNVSGGNMEGKHTLFMLTPTQLIAQKKRSSHVKAKLKALAQREGLEYIETSNDVGTRRGVRVLFWAFNQPEEVDDSALVNANKARVPDLPPTPEELERMEERREAMFVSTNRLTWYV